MGYRNSSLPIVVCIDMCSQKGPWVKVWICNSNPNLIGRFYLEFLFKTGRIASKLRLDKGTETSGVGDHAGISSAATQCYGGFP